MACYVNLTSTSRCSIFLADREEHAEATNAPARRGEWLKGTRTIIENSSEAMERPELANIPAGTAKWHNYVEKSLAVSYEVRHLPRFRNSTPSYLPEVNGNMCPYKDFYGCSQRLSS